MTEKFVEIRRRSMDKSLPLSESFKSLRTNLLYSDGVQVITITSSLANEGKTMTSFNLADSFSLMDKRVLLIDCDLRKGSIRRNFAIPRNLIGLSEALSGQANLSEVIYHTTRVNLDVIFSGKIPPNPTELLSNETFVEMLDILKTQYDYIVLDTAPMTVSMDATITGRLSDGVVLVVRNDFVRKKDIQKVKSQLERNGSRILGVVLNRVQKNQVDYQGYEYYEYYNEKAK